MANDQKVRVGGRELTVSNLDKVLYPATGTTKADVMRYYQAGAEVLIPQARRRPVTRKRWPEGVEKQSFFRKDLEDSAPEWIATGTIQHITSVNAYPLIDGSATLAWLAQVAALELHTPQWRFGEDGAPRNPDRLVLDLDPGPGVELRDTAEVALWCREILEDMGLTCVPVTSGSKGIHLYAGLDGASEADAVSKVAKTLAQHLERTRPDRVTADMSKARRKGKVFLDWSQNNGKKTTICPYSLRGRQRPTVAAPRTWDEIEDPKLRQLEFEEVMERVTDGLDPMADLGTHRDDKLATYRSMRDKRKTGEPVPDAAPQPREGDPIFVIGEHDASHLHWDFRLEHDGVLVSWAVPKGPPLETDKNRLAVQTEDHPIEYAEFEGTIPKGQYGAGTVNIWDIGTCEVEKWRANEIIVVLHGRGDGGLGGIPRRYALIRTEGENWLLKLMRDQPLPARPLAPMLPTMAIRGDITLDQHEGATFAFEMKWDGYRILADVGRDVRLISRGGKDYTRLFPHASELMQMLADGGCVDGELVALGPDGRPDFSLLHNADRDGAHAHLRYMVFDLLRLGDRDLTAEPWSTRRELLGHMGDTEHVVVPPAYTGSFDHAWRAAEELGLEGVVAKRTDSAYAPGEHSSAWLKVKRALHQEVVVVGVRTGKRDIASLLVAVPDDEGELRYAGRVGTGFSNAQLADIGAKLRRIQRATPPVDVPAEDARDAWWVIPKYVAEVQLAGATAEKKVRQASWRGWRDEKDPSEVRWEV